NDAGFPEPGIVLSSNLDELAIWQILRQIEDEAPSYGVDPAALLGRLSYGVGTRLVTSEGDPSLDGVYKLTAVKPDSEWVPAIKVSENPLKVPIPGAKRLWRIYDDRGLATADAVALAAEDLTTVESLELHHPNRDGVSRALARDDMSAVEELLVDVWNEQGRLVNDGIEEMRARRRADLERLDPGVRRLINPHLYHMSLTGEMDALRRRMVAEAQA
ncbi:MAG: nicotinate phosphoribosyltransferase, partial [Acidimicrobiia bacterium]|nr:nicotinate phosphoribosyltransferase [Acidimicrobiia bacterium]